MVRPSCRHPQKKKNLVFWNGFFLLTCNYSAYRNWIEAWLPRLIYFPFFPCLLTVLICLLAHILYLGMPIFIFFSWRAISPPERCSLKGCRSVLSQGYCCRSIHCLSAGFMTWVNDAAPFQLGAVLDLKDGENGRDCLLQPTKSCEDHKPRGSDYVFVLHLLVMQGVWGTVII